ncbi:hypothetical protein ACFYXF_14145 [Streptomyces sp. NPDC002680]|uniref:hypothetical protein n=1 Tax=Streptomyces sp. NPDC002680 TaxID=3364659 RepID=UPI0036BF1F66
MHTSPSRQIPDDEDEDESDDDSDGDGVADDVSVSDVLVLSVAEGVGEAVVSVTVFVAPDTAAAVCDTAEVVAAVNGTLTLCCWTAVGAVGVARGVTADCSCGAFAVAEPVVRDEVRSARREVSVGVDGTGTESVASSSAIPMTSRSGAVAACVRSVDWRFSEETVMPPPTRATAVATRALRCVFFQRSRWRRRAARPTGAGAGTSEPS